MCSWYLRVGLVAGVHRFRVNPESCPLGVFLALISRVLLINLHVKVALCLFVLIAEGVLILLLSQQSVAVIITRWHNLSCNKTIC